MKNLAVATGLLMGAAFLPMSAPAYAADAVAEQPPAAYNWSGAFIGGQVGYAWGDSHGEFETGDTFDPDPDGFVSGVYGGYNYQFSNNVVLGLDGDFTFSDARDDAQGLDENGAAFPFDNEGRVDLEWSAALRGRLGYALDRWLPYAAAGVAWGRVDTSVRSDPLGTYSEGEDTFTGYTVGAGVEYAFTNNLIGRAEYRFTDFGTEEFGASTLASPFSVDLETNDLRLGISYKF